MSLTSCPDEENLRQLLLGKLTGPLADEVEQHLADCDTCLSTAETISGTDRLTAAIQLSKFDEGDPDDLRHVVEQAKQLQPRSDTLGIDETMIAEDLPGATGVSHAVPSAYAEEIGFLAPAEEEDEIGRLANYRVLEVLGMGGMGVVFRAEDPQLKRQIALKVMKPNVASNRSAKDRFIREAQATAAIEHDNIVHIYQVGEDRGVPFIAMPFLRGESLQDRLNRHGWLGHSETTKIGRQIADGLEAAHQRDLIHRDIKPDNIWLEEGSDRVKIVDFGLVRSADDDAGLTQSGMVLGTPKYMAPEQAQGQVVDHRCDLFSLGSVLYRLAAGKAPFEGSNITATLIAVAQANATPINEVCEGIDPGLSELIMRLLSKDPAARPQSAREVSIALADIEKSIPGGEAGRGGEPSSGSSATGTMPTAALDQLLPTIEIESVSRTVSRVSPKRSGSGRGNRTKLLAAGLGGAAILLAGIVFFLSLGGKYDVQITLDDPSMKLRIDDEAVIIEGGDKPIRLSAGDHELIVEMAGFGTETDNFTVKKDGKNAVHVAILKGKLAFVPGGKAALPTDPVASNATPGTGSPGSGRVPPGAAAVSSRSVNAPATAVAPFDEAQAKQHQQAWADYLGLPVEYTNSIGMKFRLIPPGEFFMGCTVEEKTEAIALAVNIYQKQHVQIGAPRHKVILTRPMYVGIHEVTQAQYQKVMGNNPSVYSSTGDRSTIVAGLDTSDFPVDSMQWEGAVEFCEKLNQAEDDKSLYGAVNYRLPTSAEWEFAAWAGTTTKYWSGNTEQDAMEAGWTSFNSVDKTTNVRRPHAVGQLRANPFGLFDTLGNAWEFVQDGYDPNYYAQLPDTPVIDPVMPHVQKNAHLARGEGDLGLLGRASDTMAAQYGNFSSFRVAMSIDLAKLKMAAQLPAAIESASARPLAIAPFDAAQAKKHQQAWAAYLGEPVETTNSIGMTFALIPPGEFEMGVGAKSVHVTLTKPFRFGVHEVTQEQWTTVMETMPWVGYGAAVGPDIAAAKVSWNDAVVFCRTLTTREREAGRLPADREYRLPTEAEWEFCCRAGTVTAYSFGDDPSLLSRHAHWSDKKQSGVQPVGRKTPNAWGLYDTHGNLWEWCQDVYIAELPGGIDPLVKSGGSDPVRRGGSWDIGGANHIRSDTRAPFAATKASRDTGFRVVVGDLTPPPAVAPFDAAAAKGHQEAWAKYLGEPVETTNSIGMKLVVIPPGSFKMGQGDTSIDVTLTKPFRLGIHEVTQGQWKAVMGTEPWKGQTKIQEGEDVPASSLSWIDATEFCSRLTELARADERLSAREEYRLPTEAEWESACRVGTITKYSFGNDAAQLGQYAWYEANSQNAGEAYAHGVGLKRPNPWGLYDMHGNMWEWCFDTYSTTLTGGRNPVADSTVVDADRVHRGGSWLQDAENCRSTMREGRNSQWPPYNFGFRVAMTIDTARLETARTLPADPDRIAAEWVSDQYGGRNWN